MLRGWTKRVFHQIPVLRYFTRKRGFLGCLPANAGKRSAILMTQSVLM